MTEETKKQADLMPNSAPKVEPKEEAKAQPAKVDTKVEPKGKRRNSGRNTRTAVKGSVLVMRDNLKVEGVYRQAGTKVDVESIEDYTRGIELGVLKKV